MGRRMRAVQAQSTLGINVAAALRHPSGMGARPNRVSDTSEQEAALAGVQYPHGLGQGTVIAPCSPMRGIGRKGGTVLVGYE